MDAVFRALGDPGRRRLLDALYLRDGQSLGELCAAHPAVSRFAVMKHLGRLEAAGLIVARKVGREKLHYLNPVPIRLLHDRWIHKYAVPWAAAMADLKQTLEQETPIVTRPTHVYEVYIRTTPERLWEALTSGALSRGYYYGSIVKSDWQPGSPFVYRTPEGVPQIEGTVLEAEPPRRLVTTFSMRFDPEAAQDRPSRVTWEIEPLGQTCRLVLVHDDFEGETPTYRITGSGWSPILSGLKTLLETGEPLVIAR